jgi:predicted NAD/FAD-binding protein
MGQVTSATSATPLRTNATSAWSGSREVGYGSPRTTDRIAIIGAGAAGLAAAHYLAKRGHRSVTVFEREPRVGGKCCTIQHGGRSFELGAAVLSPLYTHVRALMREHGIEATPGASGFFFDPERSSTSYMIPQPERRRWLTLAAESARYVADVVRNRALWSPGFTHLPGDMSLPFEEWGRRHGYSEMVEMVRPWFTGFGYGYLNEIPAAYVLKYMTISGFPLSELREEGFQGLWERVARPLDVRTGVSIRRVDRDASGVVVETERETARFDYVILACPFDRALGFLDASNEERELFSKIRYVDYRVVAATTEGMPQHRYTFCAKNLVSTQTGEPMFWYRRHKESTLHTFYSIGDDEISDDTIVLRTDDMVRRMHARLGDIVKVARWSYFPHVTAEEMAAGYYRRIDALQGRRRTYYVGELLSFPTVETVTAYSADVVERFFATERAAFATGS